MAADTWPGPVALLRRHVRRTPGATLFEYAGDRDDRLTFAELDARAVALSAEIRRHTAIGDRVVILQESGLEFPVAFFACLYVGAVAVPLYPPDVQRATTRLDTVVRDADPALVLTASRHRRAVRDWLDGGVVRSSRLLLIDEAREPGRAEAEPVAVRGDEPALLQYTSGSTGDPAGVVVTHGNLVANVRQIQHAYEVSSDSVLVNWLPLFHDMGLLTMVVLPALFGIRSIHLAPATFIRHPRRWLELISQQRDANAMSPDFGYRHCVQRIAPPQRAGLDLRGWRIAGNGSEPVRPQTLDLFAEAFAAQGFDPAAFRPSYGLAEATVLVSGFRAPGPPRRLPVDRAALGRGDVRILPGDRAALGRGEVGILPVDRAALGRGEVGILPVDRTAPGRGEVRTVESGSAQVLVGCGVPAEQDVRVVDPDTGKVCPRGRVGELWVSGPNVTAGYFRQPARTAATFVPDLDGRPGPWLRTGDLGFLDQGEIFVVGRLKDLIIIDGRNHHPADVEQTAEQAHPAVAAAGVVATSVETAEGEALVVLAEVDRRAPGFAPATVRTAVRRAVADRHGVSPHDVVLVRRGALPRTTSGKVQRGRGRRLYLDGAFAADGPAAVETRAGN
ncbi:fatty acyl-AMP ligase [Nonomuraea sp. NPDC050786]|uniref:fatty acyl-AMP ligase n=1 Tax=Nonomuraea sp. NPDC050786 TaxID=3154840 RepID=UPI0033E3F385